MLKQQNCWESIYIIFMIQHLYVLNQKPIGWLIYKFTLNRNLTTKQEAQLMLTNPCNAFRGQLRSPNIVPFHMLGMVSSCAIVTLSLRHAGFLIFDFKKCCDL